MTPPSEQRAPGAARRGRIARKHRRGRELVCEYVFRPLAQPLVDLLALLRVPPPAVVLAAAATGLVAAALLAHGELVLAAVLVQLKTLLDNADGQLARQTRRLSALGRYLDAESDLLVDAALLGAIGWATGHALFALLGFVLLTLVLSVNFDLELLYRRERGEHADAQPPAAGFAGALATLYSLVYGPLDRLVEGFSEWRLRALRASGPDRLAYHDAWTVDVLANLGLSTQMAVLGVCLALGHPAAFVWWLCACAILVAALLVRRDIRVRRTRALPLYADNRGEA